MNYLRVKFELLISVQYPLTHIIAINFDVSLYDVQEIDEVAVSAKADARQIYMHHELMAGKMFSD